MSLGDYVAAMHRDLGLRRLSPVWAKLEIFLGLTAAACGLLLGIWAIQQLSAEPAWQLLAASVALQVLGVYLALAGHRSHLYQSQNKLTAYLAMLLTRADESTGPGEAPSQR
jgi:hypothetical protein